MDRGGDDNPMALRGYLGGLESREQQDPLGTASIGSLAPLRTMWAERMEDGLGDWADSPEVSNKGPWLNRRDRKDLTTSTRSDGPSLAT